MLGPVATSRARVLLLASKRAYQLDDFVAAAARLGIDLEVGTDRCKSVVGFFAEDALALDFRRPDKAAAEIVARLGDRGLSGIVPTDEVTSVIAARAARKLRLARNPVHAADAAANKMLFRERLARANVAQPEFVSVTIGGTGENRLDEAITAAAEALETAGIAFPLVIKPLHLSASRGVMRVDDRGQLGDRIRRLAALLDDGEVRAKDPEAATRILIEAFVPGPEVAYEGLLVAGEMHTLAIFDKPDPLDGPFFAETIYVTPSAESSAMRAAVAAAVTRAAAAIGLFDGPIHGELRLSERGPVVLELAARAIGGLCQRTLRYGTGISLEDILLAHAAGLDVRDLIERTRAMTGASGVYMLPVPERGILQNITGVDEARSVRGIREVAITTRPGEYVVPLPEGNTYMGFVFATGDTRAEVIATLRRAVARIRFVVAAKL